MSKRNGGCAGIGSLLIIATLLPLTVSKGETPDISANIPPVIHIEESTTFDNSGTSEGIFTVSSNTAFHISFSEPSGGIPLFTKQDVDASGNLVPNNHDHLTTSFGVQVTDDTTGTTQILGTWGGGSAPEGTPDHLVLGLEATANSPNAAIGTIAMGTRKIHLYAKGVPFEKAKCQSGTYTMTVKCTVTPET